MTENTAQQVKKVFLETFPELSDTDFDFDKDRSEYENWDSLTHMQLVSELEGNIGVSFEMDEVVDINSATDLVKLIESKG